VIEFIIPPLNPLKLANVRSVSPQVYPVALALLKPLLRITVAWGFRKARITFISLSTSQARVPEYRKHILSEEVSQSLRDIFLRDAEEYEFWIYTI